jgi:hypothetical protein
MKSLKFSLLVFAALVISSTVKAQSFTLGVRGGATYSNLYGIKSIKDNKGKVGYTAGIFARIGDRLYLEPGVNITATGAKFNFNGHEYDIKLNQLQVPILVGYKFIDKDAFNFHAAVGPEGNFNIKDRKVGDFKYKDFNTAGRLQAGVDVGSLTIDLGASIGLNKVNKGLDQRSNVFSLTLGYRFF